jgi:leucyl aminopeptidase (aminopeptidase T)
MPEHYEYELGKAADVIARELFQLKAGETLVITADTESDKRAVDAVARAAFACDAKPLVVWNAAPLGVSKAADPLLPIEALSALLANADAWLEFNNKWLLYSTVHDRAMEQNKGLRHLCLVGGNVDMLVRCIGRIDYELLDAFQTRFAEMVFAAKHVRFTTPAGEDVEFDNCHEPWAIGYGDLGQSSTPGDHYMAGQISWSIDLDSVNGTIVFDGSLDPPFARVLAEPVALTIQDGTIVKIGGGAEALQFESWIDSFKDPQMRRIAHVCAGFNPGAKLCGNILEDERVWGSTEWGIGQVPSDLLPGGISAASHCDGICLNTSIWLDGNHFMDKGVLFDRQLKELSYSIRG